MTDQIILAIGLDGGGTKTRAILTDNMGNILGRGVSGPSNHNRVGDELAESALNDAIRQAFFQAQISPRPVKSICLGMAGADRPDDQLWLEDWARRNQVSSQVICVNDGRILISAGTPQGWGCGLISGTGSLAVGRNDKGDSVRSGGWGYLFGDEGSGYWIGISALRAVAKSVDGRGPDTLLKNMILEYWKLQNSSQLISLIYGSQFNRAEIARLANIVQLASEQGDRIAATIQDNAGHELSKMLLSTAVQLNFSASCPCAFGGGVLTHDHRLQNIVIEDCAINGLTLEPTTIVEEPALGAIRIALQSI